MKFSMRWIHIKENAQSIYNASKKLYEKLIRERFKRSEKEEVSSFDFHTEAFSRNEQQFLDRWLQSYIELDNGRPPSRKIEEHILEMLEGRLPIDTIGMETYIKWKSANQWHDISNYKPRSGPNDKPLSGGAFADFQLSLNEITNQFEDLKSRATADAAALLAVLISSDFSKSISGWTESTFEGAATIYDKAADAVYNTAHEGGALHRLFDGSHTFGGMWEAVKGASPNDSLAMEVEGYVDAFLKDVSTVNGLPFFTLSPENFDALADTLSKGLGIPKAWTADIASFNMAELFGTSLGVIAIALNWNKADRERFADFAASMGIAAAFSANPLLGIVALVGLAKALEGEKDKVAYTELLKGVGRGGVGTGVLLMASSVIGGPAWIGAIVGLILAIYARKTLGDVSAEYMADWMSSVMRTAHKNAAEGIQSVRGVFPAYSNSEI